MRRLFSRSELRRAALEESRVAHTDIKHPRVTKWSKCPICLSFIPTYKMEVDHLLPIIAVDESLEDLTWDTVVDRIWCDINNLKAVCKPCHIIKTKAENKERRRLKKLKVGK